MNTMKIKKYRKKPVVIEAYQTDKVLTIHTLEGDMIASKGDYIITGVDGEQYPCKPDIFEKTYEPVEDQQILQVQPSNFYLQIQASNSTKQDFNQVTSMKCAL